MVCRKQYGCLSPDHYAWQGEPRLIHSKPPGLVMPQPLSTRRIPSAQGNARQRQEILNMRHFTERRFVVLSPGASLSTALFNGATLRSFLAS
jgi:hypothetical protein